MANRKFVIAWCQKKIKDMEKTVIYDLSSDIESRARRNFMRVSSEIPAVDNYIEVWSSIKANGFTVSCGGTQVLFTEFGAGHTLSHKTPMTTNDQNIQVEKAPRPIGVVGIGEYGKGRGKDPKWYFSESGLIPQNNKNHTSGKGNEGRQFHLHNRRYKTHKGFI